MVVGAHIERCSFICSLSGRRRAIEWLGIGWLLLFPFLTFHPIKATLRAILFRRATSGGQALMRREAPFSEGADG
jgi:hypothetical protein